MYYYFYGVGSFFRKYISDGVLVDRLSEFGYDMMGVVDICNVGEITVGNRSLSVLNRENLNNTDVDRIVISTSPANYSVIKDDLIKEGINPTKIYSYNRFLKQALFGDHYNYKLSIVCIVKWEEKNIVEWIEYHRMIGIDHFFIYDNGPSSELAKILKLYIEDGVVDLITFPGVARQIDAYNHAIDNYSALTKYMAFIDADEFIFTKSASLYSFIDERLDGNVYINDNEEFIPGGIGINWRLFGTSGYQERSYKLVTVTHLLRSQDEFLLENRHIKTIANPRCILNAGCHNMKYIPLFSTFSVMGSVINGSFFPDGTREENVRIYHYAFKSIKEIEDKYNRGYALKDVSEEEKLQMISDGIKQDKTFLNVIKDETMLQFGKELALRVDNINRIIAEDDDEKYMG